MRYERKFTAVKAENIQKGMNHAIEEVYDYEYSFHNAGKRLDESEQIPTEDKKLIRRFVQHLKAEDVSIGRFSTMSGTRTSLPSTTTCRKRR